MTINPTVLAEIEQLKTATTAELRTKFMGATPLVTRKRWLGLNPGLYICVAEIQILIVKRASHLRS
jgi:hypothetical protein